MFFANLEMHTVHTVSGIVTLASLGVAVLEFARLRLTERRTAAASGLVTVTPAEPAARSGLEGLPSVAAAADSESTIVIAIPQVDASSAAAPEVPLAAGSALSSNDQKTPHILLVCQDDIEPDEATSPQARILVTASGVTDRGKKRRINEDCFLLLHDYAVFAVADGMGGYNGGEIASSLAVNTIREAFESKRFDNDLRSNVPLPRRSRELASALLEANRTVSDLAQERPELSEMGTTLVAARFSPNKQRVYIANVGDSRCYRLRQGTLTQLTTDHTMSRLGDQGPTQNQLYRAIGVKPIVDIDVVVDMPQAEDVYLLCSDGLPKMASTEEIEALLLDEPDLEIAAHRLIDLANAAGGRDNVTVVLVRVQDRIPRDERLELNRKLERHPGHALRDPARRRVVNGTE